jgi:hypothetical protein
MMFTKLKVPFDDDDELFSDQLSRLSRMLNLTPPTFPGRVIPCVVPEIVRWEIETRIEGRTIGTPTDIVVYSRMYPGWETGVMMAMEEALAHICGMYVQEISEMDNFIYQFGRRNHEGWALRMPGRRADLPWTEVQLEDMGSYAFNLEDMLRSEMDATDDAMYQLLQKDEKIEQLENTIEKLKEKNKSLETANDKLTGKVEDQEAQIIGFRGQCIYLHQDLMKYKPWPPKKGTTPTVENKESTSEQVGAEPKKLEPCQPTVEEDSVGKVHAAPPSPVVKRRKIGNTKAYLA